MDTKRSRRMAILVLRGWLLLALLTVLALGLGPTFEAHAASTITVNTTDYELNSDGDCSPREAVQAAEIDIHDPRQMAIWTFDGSPSFSDGSLMSPKTQNVTGFPTLTMYNQNIDDNGEGGIAYTDIAGVTHDAGRAAAWDDIRGDGPDAELVLSINTTGWEDLSIRFDYKSELANNYDLKYSTVWRVELDKTY